MESFIDSMRGGVGSKTRMPLDEEAPPRDGKPAMVVSEGQASGLESRPCILKS